MSIFSPEQAIKVVVLHAYSPHNAGDGLLVELALRAIRAVTPNANIVVVASDAAAFEGPGYIQWESHFPLPLNNLGRRTSMALTAAAGPSRRIAKLVRDSDLIVAVGGGYMRGGGIIESLKSFGAHYGQLKLAAKFGDRAIYLPQSIGPFSGVYRRLVHKELAKIERIFVRDDRSLRDLSMKNVVRCPDMAVLELADQNITAPRDLTKARPVVIARPLGRPRSYYRLLNEFAASGEYDWALQSVTGANNDGPLTRSLAGSDVPHLSDLLSEGAPRIVISTRLHGALSALIAGYPAIHLSYERKGWGAFEDLGLGQFVVNARDATLAEVRGLQQEISTNPKEYWKVVVSNQDKIRQSSSALHSVLLEVSKRNSPHMRSRQEEG